MMGSSFYLSLPSFTIPPDDLYTMRGPPCTSEVSVVGLQLYGRQRRGATAVAAHPKRGELVLTSVATVRPGELIPSIWAAGWLGRGEHIHDMGIRVHPGERIELSIKNLSERSTEAFVTLRLGRGARPIMEMIDDGIDDGI